MSGTTSAARALARSSERAGILLVVLSAAVWPFLDASAKHLGMAGYPATQIAWGRFFLGVFLLVPVVLLRHGAGALLPSLEPLHLLRAALPAASAAFFFAGLARLPFGSAAALLFTNPILITLLSALLLRERVGARRWLAVGAGFAGALVVVRPGAGLFHGASLYPLLAALAFALLAILNRRLAGHTPAAATTLHYSVAASVLLLPSAALGWRPFDLGLLGWLLFMAGVGVAAMWLVTAAYERAEASALAPFHYLELPSAVTVGVLLFGDRPDLFTLGGIALILGAGLAIAILERAAAQATA